MKKKIFFKASLIILGFLVQSPLHSMEVEDDKSIKLNRTKSSTTLNRLARDHHLCTGNYAAAAFFAIKVINETPESLDNEDATIEDFRAARDIFRLLAKDFPDHNSDATAYADRVTSCEEAIKEDYIIIRDLYLKQGDYRNASYYNDLLPEKL